MNWKVLTEYPDAETERRWNEFLGRAAYPTHYTTPNFLVDPFVRGGERFAVLACGDDGAVNGVLTGVFDGKRIVSGLPVRPQTAFLPGRDEAATAAALFEGMLEMGGDRLGFVEFHSWEPVEEFTGLGFQTEICEGDDSIVMLDLSKGADELFKDFSQTRRNELRKVMRRGEVGVKTLETEDELRELYEIHCDWNRRKGNEPDSREDFEFAASQTGYRKILVAVHDGRVIAGSYYRFCPGGVVEYAANNSLPEYLKLRPNDLLGWRSIEWACGEGFTHYSMGGSHLFLRRFGGELFQTRRYKMDMSLLHVHDMKEGLINLGLKTYRSLPSSVRSKIKDIAGKK